MEIKGKRRRTTAHEMQAAGGSRRRKIPQKWEHIRVGGANRKTCSSRKRGGKVRTTSRARKGAIQKREAISHMGSQRTGFKV